MAAKFAADSRPAAPSAARKLQDEVQRLAQLAMQGEYAQVRLLASSELAMARDEGRRTVLMLTADTDWTPMLTGKCVEYLLHLGADPSALDTLGNTCAHVAARRDHLRLLALLPFRVKFLTNNEGNTPLMLSAQAGSWRCAKHLLHLLRQWRYNKKDNDLRMRLLKMQNLSKQTALDLAWSSGHSELAEVIEIELRLVVAANGHFIISAQDAETREKLERLVIAGDTDALRRPAAATRVACDLPDYRGRTALMVAVRRGPDGDEAAQLLMELGADVTCADVWGCSCLFGDVRDELDLGWDLPFMGLPNPPRCHVERQ